MKVTSCTTIKHIQLILDHFEEPIFPRSVSSKTTQGRQVPVNNVEEVYRRFEEANFIDCRINAYPVFTNYKGINRQAPNFVMCDLDTTKFRIEKLLIKTLQNTTENIVKDLGEGTEPTVLFTGNGYHVYRPIKLPVLESESIFAPYENPSTEFIRYAAQKWTEGKNDPSNHPSVNSCLLRVPGSINSKNNKVVEVVQLWNGIRPAANSMLFNFQIELAAKKLAHRSKRNNSRKVDNYYDTYYVKGKRFHRSKTYRYFGYTNNSNVFGTIDWIESNILLGSGISNFRKITIDLILAPYLVNVKKCDYDVAYDTITKWLDKCGKKRSLTFNVRYKVNHALNHAKDQCMYPMKLDTIKSKYPEVCEEIFVTKHQQKQEQQ